MGARSILCALTRHEFCVHALIERDTPKLSSCAWKCIFPAFRDFRFVTSISSSSYCRLYMTNTAVLLLARSGPSPLAASRALSTTSHVYHRRSRSERGGRHRRRRYARLRGMILNSPEAVGPSPVLSKVCVCVPTHWRRSTFRETPSSASWIKRDVPPEPVERWHRSHSPNFAQGDSAVLAETRDFLASIGTCEPLHAFNQKTLQCQLFPSTASTAAASAEKNTGICSPARPEGCIPRVCSRLERRCLQAAEVLFLHVDRSLRFGRFLA